MAETLAPTPEDLAPENLLPPELIERIHSRAAAIDAAGGFVDEDLADLAAAGYTRLLVPHELGGLGGTMRDACRAQRRLAAAAPATALTINMHLVVTAAALLAHRRGLDPARAILADAAAGELFAFGISEPGNDAMLFDSFTTATAEAAGGYRLSGTKIFTSMAPGWTRLVVHGRDDRDPDDPRIVFGVIDRTAEVTTRDDWDTHGMRGTQSRTTVLEAAPLPADRVVTTTAVGPGPDPFVFSIFGAFELLLASVYTGIAQRGIELGVEAARDPEDPDVRRRLADAAIGADGSVLQIDALAADLDAFDAPDPVPDATDHGQRWFLHFSGVKARSGEAAVAAIDQVLRASGGRHYSRGSELERISRDVRAVLYHPSDDASVHRSYARALLGEIGQTDTEN